MGSITSNTFDTRAGSGTITITHASLTGGQSFEVSGIGEVEADFDLEDQSESANNVYFKLGEFSFKAFDRLSDGTSLFETLDALSVTDQVDLAFDFTTNASRVIADQYVFTIEDMEFDRDRRETSITGATQVTSDLQISIATFFTNEISAAEDETFNITGTPDCIDAKTFIDNALPLFNSSNASQNLSSNFSAGGKTVANSYIVVDDAAAANTDVDELLFEMAAGEGAFIGSIMGYNFFVGRKQSTSGVASLTQDDVKEQTLKVKPGLDVYNSITVNFEGNSTNYSTWTSSATQTYNTDAEKTLTVTFRNNVMAWAAWNSGTSQYDDVGGTTNDAATDGRDAYAAAYGADKARKIELTILGIDTLGPHQSFTLDASFPSLLQGQTFRPSKLTYNFNQDEIKIEAYKIA